jgi:hypothetical protein
VTVYSALQKRHDLISPHSPLDAIIVTAERARHPK